ncbi:hypothetical protein JXA34_01810 [Patescibacteria group bacterium]|nr:hypothetical protein [Patescibacteria group bacterium]
MKEANKKSPETNSSFFIFLLSGILLTQILIVGSVLFAYFLLRKQILLIPETKVTKEEVAKNSNTSTQDNTTLNTDLLVRNHILTLLNRDDTPFSNMLATKNSWRTFTHPEGIYTLEHPADLSINKVVKEEQGIISSIFDIYEVTYEDNPDFHVYISFDSGGGGSLCANSSCYDVLDYGGLEPIDINSFESYGGSEERLRDIGANYMELRINFEPTENSTYLGRFSAHYENLDQRNIIKEIAKSLVLNKNNFPLIQQ